MHQKISPSTPKSPGSRGLPSLCVESPVWSRIAGTLAEMGFPEEVAPFSPPKVYPELNGKRVLMVDDDKTVLGCFVPDLMAATMGRAVFFHCSGKSFEEVCSTVRGFYPEPDVILMDSAICAREKFFGFDVAADIRKVFKRSVILGFSSSPADAEKFIAAGADGFVVKRPAEPWASVADVAEIAGRLEKVVKSQLS